MMTIQWYQWLALAALGICLIALLLHFLRLVRMGKPVDFSRPAGTTGKAVRYAFTGAMNPARKESAFLHLPTYTAGLLYHLGTFLSMFLFFFILCGLMPEGWFAKAILLFLCISSGCGIAILLKRIAKKELRSLSNPDDFVSNFLVTFFQVITVVILIYPIIQSTNLQITQTSNPPNIQSSNPPILQSFYYLTYSLLMLYIPIGKLRHTVYFFAARYHLGYFFGWRGVWPPAKLKNDGNG
jgi:uncharacterized membrane protein